MPQKKLHTYILIFALTILILTACSSTVTSNDSLILIVPIDQYGMNEEGVLVADDGLVWFYDFETEEKVVACNLPDCPHEPYHHTRNPDPICLATPPSDGRIESVGMYDNNIYMFVSEGFDKSKVYQIDLQNSSRKVLSSFDWNVAFLNSFEMKDDMAFFVGDRPIFEEDEPFRSSSTEIAILSVDLKNGEVTQHGQNKDKNYGSLRNFRKIDDKLYYYYTYHDPGAEEDIQEVIEEPIGEAHHYLYEYDLNTDQERIIYDIHGSDNLLYNFDADYFYFLSGDRTELFKTDWELSESEVLFSGEEIGVSAVLRDGFIFTQHRNFDGPYYYYEFESNGAHTFNRPTNEFNVQTKYDDWVFFSINEYPNPDTMDPDDFSEVIESGDYVEEGFVMMHIDDYLAGETDYIYLK